MEIGSRIRSLRTAKMMTQAQLCGDTITRNMLSEIENGKATPSLATLQYLADKLGVSVGYILATDREIMLFQKATCIENIRAALRLKQYDVCLSICSDEMRGADADDEIREIMALCHLGLAMDDIREGKLHAAATTLDCIADDVQDICYPADSLRAEAIYSFRYLGLISPSLYSNAFDVDENVPATNDFCKFVEALGSIENGEYDYVREKLLPFIPEDSLQAALISAKMLMEEKQYEAALPLLRSILDHIDRVDRILFYFAVRDAETCCKETGRYKDAYLLSQEKVTLLEKMLREEE